MRLSFYTALAVFLGVVLIQPTAAVVRDKREINSRGTRADVTISNEYITAGIDDDGLYMGMETTGGDPDDATDNNIDLVYAGLNASTSFDSVKVGSEVDVPGGLFGSGTFTQAPTVVSADTVEATYSFEDVSFNKRITFTDFITGKKDHVRVDIAITNNTGDNAEVGYRSMIDTQISGNDGTLIVTNNVDGLWGNRQEEEYFDADVPMEWYSLQRRNFHDAGTVTQALLDEGGATPPDRLVVASWPRIVGTDYDFTINENVNATFDSAVGMWWEQTMATGETVTLTYYYGMAPDDTPLATFPSLSTIGALLLMLMMAFMIYRQRPDFSENG